MSATNTTLTATRDRLRAVRRGLGSVIVVWGVALVGLQGWRIG